MLFFISFRVYSGNQEQQFPRIIFVVFLFWVDVNQQWRFLSQAYKNWVAEHGGEELVPGLKRSSEQMFFLSYAQVI